MSMTNHPFHTQLLITLITDRKIIAYRVLISTSLHVPSGLKSNSNYKLSFILERRCEISLNNCCYPNSLHLLPPLFCWLCLLQQQPPPQQRFGDKTGMPRTGTFPTLSFYRIPFIESTTPWPPIQLRGTRPWGLTVPATCSAMGRLSLLLTSSSLGFTPGRIKSESFFPHSLWACSMPGFVRNMTPGVHR